MQPRFKITQRTILLVTIPLVFQLLFVWILLDLLHRSEVETANEQHAKEIIYELDALDSRFTDAGFAMGGYSMTKNRMFLQLYKGITSAFPSRLSSLQSLMANDPKQLEGLKQISTDWQSMSKILDVAVTAIEGGTEHGHPIDEKQLYAEIRSGKARLDGKVSELVEEKLNYQRQLPALKKQSRAMVISFLIFGVLASTTLTVLLAYFFNMDLTKKLKLLADNSGKLASGRELPAPLQGNDELALLDRTLRTMANELSEAARKEKEILENAVDVICSVDNKGKITKINHACQDTWGYSPDDLIGTSILNISSPEDRDRLWNAFETAKRDAEPGSVEARLIGKNGNLLHVLWSLKWSSTQSSFYCVGHDITESKKLAQLKQDFMDMVSHDLRSPLTSIQFTLGLLAEGAYGAVTEEAREQITQSEFQINRLVSMVNDLLDIERLEYGAPELDLQLLATLEVVTKAVESLKSLIENKRIEIQLPSIQFGVRADENRLIQILVNLLANAIKFSNEGGRVTITTIKGANWIEFSVIDQGRGIRPEDQEAIFERFKQTEKTDSTKGAGFGLGLPICKMLVEQHGGSIGVESKQNEGSRFWFRIPNKD